MDAETFEALVLEALNSLPAEFARYLENVEIQIEARRVPIFKAGKELKDRVNNRPA